MLSSPTVLLLLKSTVKESEAIQELNIPPKASKNLEAQTSENIALLTCQSKYDVVLDQSERGNLKK